MFTWLGVLAYLRFSQIKFSYSVTVLSDTATHVIKFWTVIKKNTRNLRVARGDLFHRESLWVQSVRLGQTILAILEGPRSKQNKDVSGRIKLTQNAIVDFTRLETFF